MALTLWRRRSRIYPQEQTQWIGPQPIREPGLPSDDYILQTDMEAARPPAGLQVVKVLQVLLIVVIALLSLAVFWIVGLIFGIL